MNDHLKTLNIILLELTKHKISIVTTDNKNQSVRKNMHLSRSQFLVISVKAEIHTEEVDFKVYR